MSGYTPVFSSLFRGSLCGQWPALPVFCTLLPLADRYGVLDFSVDYLARVTGWPADLLWQGIAQLETTDPASRSPEEDGRRLVRLRTNTEWGWKIVNFALYKEKARKASFDAARTADGRNAERMQGRQEAKTREDPRRPAITRDNPRGPALKQKLNNTKAVPRKRGPPARKVGKKTPLPADFSLDEEMRLYAVDRLPGVNGPALWESFKGKALAKGWEYANWRQAWQEFVRNSAANSGHFAAGQYPKASADRGAVF